MPITYQTQNTTISAYDGETRIGKVGVPDIRLHWADGIYIRLAGIGGVGTDETHRGQGIAGKMMDAAKTFARENGYTVSALTTNLENNARRLYARAGYTTVFRPGRFQKPLHPVEIPNVHGVTLRPYRDGDERLFAQNMDAHYAAFFGFRAKSPDTWRALRSQYLSEEPDAFCVAEADGRILGWTGIFRKWVGLCSEIWTLPDRARGAIAQALLARLERHHSAQNRTACHIWTSPQDRFTADLLARNGYTFAEKRVFMLHIIDLPGLLRDLLPLLEARLTESPWAGALKLVTPEHRAVLHIGETVTVGAEEPADAELRTDAPTLCRLLTGALRPYEAYIENLLSVAPRYTDDIHALLARLFPPLSHIHPADDLW